MKRKIILNAYGVSHDKPFTSNKILADFYVLTHLKSDKKYLISIKRN